MSVSTLSDPAQPTRNAQASQRLLVSQAMLALGVYAVFAVVQHVEVLLGMIDARDSWLLTVPQMLWGLGGITGSYAITGPARGAVLLIMVLVLLFGIFALKPAQSRLLALSAVCMLGGVMTWKAWTDPTRYDPRVEALHLVFAVIVTVAVAVLAERLGTLRARLVQQKADLAAALERIQSLATRDELTGLINRRAALDGLRAEVRRRDRAKPTLCVGLIDLDHFKRINDTHGHAAGDRVLRGFAEVAASVVRVPDLLARWGGEEFLLVMPATDEAEGAACLARLRLRLLQLTFDDVAPGLRVTFSAGVAACSSEGDVEQAIDRADQAMYEAKRSGRDRVLRASQMPVRTEGSPAALRHNG